MGQVLKIVYQIFIMKIGHNLQLIRKQRGYTQKYVAEQLGVTESTYCRYETDERKLPLETAYILADIFHITTDYMRNMTVKWANNTTLTEDSTNILNYLTTEWSGDYNSMIQLLGAYASLPVEMRKDVAEHCICMFVNGIVECDKSLVEYINVNKCKEIVSRLKGDNDALHQTK